MTQPLPAPTDPPSDPEVAAALDAVIDALRAGRNVDRAELLARHPELAQALEGLDQLLGGQATVTNSSGHAAEPPPRPESIGPYAIEGELGSGSFGLVYLAHDPGVRRKVALKVLHPGRLAKTQSNAEFLGTQGHGGHALRSREVNTSSTFFLDYS